MRHCRTDAFNNVHTKKNTSDLRIIYYNTDHAYNMCIVLTTA